MIKREDWWALGVSLVFLLLPLALFYAELPLIQKDIPIHWNLGGPDKFIPPAQFPTFVLLIAGIMVFVWGVRFIYPLRQNVEKFRRAYNGFIVALAFLISLLLSASVQWAAGEQILLDILVYIVVGVVLVVAGVLMYVSRRNWAVGFRNPWTLSSDRVWEAVNREAGVLTSVVGILIALAGVCRMRALVMLLLFVLFTGYAVFTVHSYMLWRRER